MIGYDDVLGTVIESQFLLNNYVKPIAQIPTKWPSDLSRNSAPPSCRSRLAGAGKRHRSTQVDKNPPQAREVLFDRLGIDRYGGNRDQLLIVRGAGGVGTIAIQLASLPD